MAPGIFKGLGLGFFSNSDTVTKNSELISPPPILGEISQETPL